MPSLTQLEYIVAVSRLQHFGDAAKACHISQPTLSMQIHKAEQELGVQLFDRDKKPIEVTAKGIAIIEQAKVILYETERLQQISKKNAMVVSGTFRLGVIPTLAPYIVPSFIGPFAKSFPLVELNIDEMKTQNIIAALHSRHLDGGVLATPLFEKDLKERVLFYEPFYLYARENDTLLQKKQIDGASLNVNEMWLLQDGHCFRNQVVNYCSVKKTKGSLAENVRFESGNFETLRNLVRSSGGHTLLPLLFIKTLPLAEQKTMVRSFQDPIPTREVSLIHRHNPLKIEIIEAIEKVLKLALPTELQNLEKKNIDVLKI